MAVHAFGHAVITTAGNISKNRLWILELDMIPYLEFIQSGRIDLQNVPGWLTGSVDRPPAARQDSIDHKFRRIDPNDAKVHENEHHMDGSIKTAVAPLDQ